MSNGPKSGLDDFVNAVTWLAAGYGVYEIVMKNKSAVDVQKRHNELLANLQKIREKLNA